jgi:hypothetical protein
MTLLARFLLAASTAAAALVLAAGPASAAPAAGAEPVGCRENAQVDEPVRVDRRTYRVVRGTVALPARGYVHEPVRSDEPAAYPYWTKLGLLLRVGSGPVVVRVPAAWRKRAIVGWGYANLHEPGPVVRFEGCRRPPTATPKSRWLAYAGGVSVSAPACVPLLVTAAGRTTRVELAIGRRCR